MSLAKRSTTKQSAKREFLLMLDRQLAQSSHGDPARAALHGAALACRELLSQRWARTQAEDAARGRDARCRRVHYLSMEFLMGRALRNALAALDLTDTLRQWLADHRLDLATVIEAEPDAALGNGGLGRLAACFLDSFAELGLPSFGYGIRYRFGMFAQAIQDGRQVERADDWMRDGTPWDIQRPALSFRIGFGGTVGEDGQGGRHWQPAEVVLASGHDFVVPAVSSERVSTLRQWQASAARPIDFARFAQGEYLAAGQHLLEADALNWVLYPDDSTEAGRELRLKQEAFLVCASLADLLARHLDEHGEIESLAHYNAIHLNDTHPALAPAELMRLLLDQHGLSWDAAWQITRQAISYTNHTLMPEALETWPLRMFERLLPRHLEIIFEINHRHLEAVRARFPGDTGLIERCSLIDERGERRVRMAALAIVASQRVNGVAELHSKLMVDTIFADFARLFPQRFINVTNGVTPRRWVMQCNPELAKLLDQEVGSGWRRDARQLRPLAARAERGSLQHALAGIKRTNKQRLAADIEAQLGISIDPDSMFDVHVKRIHEYKRQLLNLLHVVARYQSMLAHPEGADGKGWVARTVIIAGKAASAYHTAKQIVQLTHDIGRRINADARLNGRLKLVFLPNYGVSLAERIIPATDLSEQISTAGTEASGTGNMKFAFNGALTIGTWDGANIEMAEAMGVENMFVFGLRAEQVIELKQLGYDPRSVVANNAQLRAVLDAISRGDFSPGEPQRYRGLIDGLLQNDRYLLLADFADYVQAQQRADQLFRDPNAWQAQAARTIAGMGRFSTDRTVAEYVDSVWSVQRAAGSSTLSD
ncbi:glycogen/starch/alpha-glucan phosphorylase [Pseudomarimonas arenosa]|uniref:Alpha-1,4 glucan phosphorylase n=1 Tax=Pseudomarimonas arenosa TaxID=2774145 RepID=A0AAW3ZMF8_9GAMM|nr:glycogen/starch/alpha-glucan phosphorylase [Pseudomarimonas arenosa]MBD8527310.1 glycogen/starch/alpha-glucan phosphorylase [Pseudomarimonas arenosa]